MELRFLGGAREIGRSAVLVNDRLLLDYGMLTGTPPQFPLGSARGGAPDVEPEAVVVSHGHLDHVGAVPSLVAGDRRPPIHWTEPTYELAMTLARDTLDLHGGTYDCPFTETEVQRVTQVSRTHGFEESFEAAGHEVTLYRAGHIPGAAHVLVDDGDTRLLYTGDFHLDGEPTGEVDGEPTDEATASGETPAANGGTRSEGIAHPGGQRLVTGSAARPDADVVITESTYAGTSHPPRPEIERQFAQSLRTTTWEGGTVVVPAFAIGRTQEIMLVCAAHDIDCYVDGMGKRVTRMFRRAEDFVRDPEALKRAVSHARFVTGKNGQRERIAADNTVIVTTAGMLSGGPAMTYLPAIRRNPTNKVALTGFQVEGTPGRELVDTGRCELDGRVVPVAAQVEQYDFSAHADEDELRAFLTHYRDATVLVNHGDRCGAFAEDLRFAGFDARAPTVGETVEVGG